MFNELQRLEKRYEELEKLLARPQTISHKTQYNQYAKEIAKKLNIDRTSVWYYLRKFNLKPNRGKNRWFKKKKN